MMQHPGADYLNRRYGPLGWCIRPWQPVAGRFAIWGCSDDGLPRLVSGFVSYDGDTITDLLDQVIANQKDKP